VKHYRIRPDNTACLHCWFVAAMEAYIAARPAGGMAGLGENGKPTVDYTAIASAGTSIAAGALRGIRDAHGAKAAVEEALDLTEDILTAAGANYERVDGVCAEHPMVQ
jgi:hypothetical protein